MVSNPLQISKKVFNQLFHSAKHFPDLEVCGLIGIKNGYCKTLYPIDNIDEHPSTNFQLDPKQQISAFSKMRENHETEFAIYHSHPTTPAYPSITDIELVTYPDAVYLIISINHLPNIRCYTIKNKSIQELSLKIIGC